MSLRCRHFAGHARFCSQLGGPSRAAPGSDSISRLGDAELDYSTAVTVVSVGTWVSAGKALLLSREVHSERECTVHLGVSPSISPSSAASTSGGHHLGSRTRATPSFDIVFCCFLAVYSPFLSSCLFYLSLSFLFLPFASRSPPSQARWCWYGWRRLGKGVNHLGREVRARSRGASELVQRLDWWLREKEAAACALPAPAL